MSPTRIRSQAFTLIELLVSITIFVSLMALLTASFVGMARIGERAAAVTDLHHEARGILSQLRQDLTRIQPQCAMFVDRQNQRVTFMTCTAMQIHEEIQERGGSDTKYGRHGDVFYHDLVWVRWDWRDNRLRRAMSPGIPTVGYNAPGSQGRNTVVGDNGDGRGLAVNGRGWVFPQQRYEHFEPLDPARTQVAWPADVDPSPLSPAVIAPRSLHLANAVPGVEGEAPSQYNSRWDVIHWWSPPADPSKQLVQVYVSGLFGDSSGQSGVPTGAYRCEVWSPAPANARNRYFAVRNEATRDGVNRDRMFLLGPHPDGEDTSDPFFPSRLAPVAEAVVRFDLEFFGDAALTQPVLGAGSGKAIDGRPMGAALSGYSEPVGTIRPRFARVSFVMHTLELDRQDHQDYDGDADIQESLAQAIADASEALGESLEQTVERFERELAVALPFTQVLRIME